MAKFPEYLWIILSIPPYPAEPASPWDDQLSFSYPNGEGLKFQRVWKMSNWRWNWWVCLRWLQNETIWVSNRLITKVEEDTIETYILKLPVVKAFYFLPSCMSYHLLDEFLKIYFVIFNTWCQCSSVQLLSHVWFFATPWTAACQASLSITNSWSPPKPMSIESLMPSNHLILCHPLLLLPSIFSSIRVFSNESTLHMRRPKYWSFSFSIIPSMEHPGLISFIMDWLDLLAVQGTLKSLLQHHSQKHQFFSTQLSL